MYSKELQQGTSSSQAEQIITFAMKLWTPLSHFIDELPVRCVKVILRLFQFTLRPPRSINASKTSSSCRTTNEVLAQAQRVCNACHQPCFKYVRTLNMSTLLKDSSIGSEAGRGGTRRVGVVSSNQINGRTPRQNTTLCKPAEVAAESRPVWRWSVGLLMKAKTRSR